MKGTTVHMRYIVRELVLRYQREISIVFLAAWFAVSLDSFFHLDNLSNLLRQIAPLLLLAGGQTCVLLTRGIDLSQGATIGILSVLLVFLFPLLGIPGAIVTTILAASVLGIINGLLVTRLNLDPFIVTLSTMYILIGIAMYWTGGTPITDLSRAQRDFFELLAERSIIYVPIGFLTSAILLAGLWYLLRKTRLGLYIYAIGSNPIAAHAHGLPRATVVTAAYVLSAVMTSFATILLTARIDQGNPSLGSGLLFESIGGAVIGGVALSGGVGGVWAATRGVVLLLLIQNGLNLSNMDSHLREVSIGLLILVGVALSKRKEEFS